MKNFSHTSEDLLLSLKHGSPVVFPTDTLPALAVLPKYSKKLWQLKQRPSTKPLILMGSTKEVLFENVQPCAIEDAILVATKYWPGALTMVLPAFGSIVEDLNKSDFTIGLRGGSVFIESETDNTEKVIDYSDHKIIAKKQWKDAKTSSGGIISFGWHF